MSRKTATTLLKEKFSLFPVQNKKFDVTLTNQAIVYQGIDDKKGKSEVVLFTDIIGCRCKRQANQTNATVYFTVYAYPFKKGIFGDKNVREKKDITFGVDSCETFLQNLDIAKRWRNVIMTLARDIPIEDVDNCCVPEPIKLLILVNPHSGSGKAAKIFEKSIKPMLDEADIHYKVINTEYPGHAMEMMKSVSVADWYGVVIVSGDGLLYEVVNGLMNRPDWMEAMKINFGILPGGSGNALCCSLNYAAGETFRTDFAMHSTFVLLKHKVLPMDLVVVETSKKRLFSFLSVTWGIISDIDYESEKYRKLLGGARFTYSAVKRIAGLRHYRGKLSFLPITKSKHQKGRATATPYLRTFSLRTPEGSVSDIRSEDVLNSDTYRINQQGSMSLPEGMCKFGTTNSTSENMTDANSACNGNIPNSFSIQTTPNSTLQNCEDNCEHENCFTEDGKMWESVKQITDDDGIVTECTEAVKTPGQPVPSPLLPPLNQPIPDDWITMNGEFITVCAVYQTHLGDDMLASPQSRLNDGAIYLMIVKKGVSKNNLLKLFLAFENGEHMDSPYVEIIPVLAFRLEPESSDGNIMVDGEKIPVGPLQGQVLPGLSKIMAIK